MLITLTTTHTVFKNDLSKLMRTKNCAFKTYPLHCILNGDDTLKRKQTTWQQDNRPNEDDKSV